MKIIDCSSKLLEYDVHKPLEFIEQVGRVCYKSEEAIKEGSAEKFVKRLVNNSHFAMLEHATFIFMVDEKTYNFLYSLAGMNAVYNEEDVVDGVSHLNFTSTNTRDGSRFLVSGNLRAINNVRYKGFFQELVNINPDLYYRRPIYPIEAGSEHRCKLITNLFNLPELKANEILYHCYLSFLCTTDRGVTHELVRHREMSFAQESTRYCNYSKGKFGNELTFVKPYFYKENSHETVQWLKACKKCEKRYLNLVSSGVQPQGARSVLINSIASTIAMTANVKEFIHFFNLRYAGRTGMPHPDMLNLTKKMYSQYTEYFNGKNLSLGILGQLHV